MLSLEIANMFFIQKCPGSFVQFGPCAKQPPCPAPVVVWGPWEPYSRCTTTCGIGYSMRYVSYSFSACLIWLTKPLCVNWWNKYRWI